MMTASPNISLFNRYVDLDRQAMADTSAMFDQLNSDRPMFWCDQLNAWVISRYEDVVSVSKDTTRFVNGRVGMYRLLLGDDVYNRARPMIEMLSMFLGMADPPHHTRLRGLVRLAFTPRMIERMRPVTQRIADDLLDKIEDRGEKQFDFVADFTAPLPARVIVAMLAMPEKDLAIFKKWASDFSNFVGAAAPTPEAALQAKRSLLDEAVAYFAVMIEQRRRHPGDDLISALVQAHDEGDKLNEKEIVGTLLSLLIGGHETTQNFISNALICLDRHHDQFEQIKSDRSLLDGALEEVLRYESPQFRQVRIATQDVTMHGQTIKQGQSIFVALAVANRDPAVFDRCHEFDIRRNPNKHVAFGIGPHFCIGSLLTRIEAHVAITAVMDRLPTIQVVDRQIDWRPLVNMRGPRSLQVSY